MTEENPNASEKDDCNIRNSTAIPSHGSIPRWLKDITESIEESRRSPKISNDRMDSGVEYTFINTSLNSTDIPSNIPHIERVKSEKNTRAKSGRRSSLASQIYTTNLPNNVVVNSADYLVPRLDDSFDFKIVNIDLNQQSLEKSWKSLNYFNQTHKGRLDNPAAFKTIEQSLEGSSSTTPLSAGSEPLPSYSPSFTEQVVPSRSKSVMANYVPLYVYENIKRATEPTPKPKSHKLSKSKSSEYLIADASLQNMMSGSNSDSNFILKSAKPSCMFDTALERRLNDYRMKVVKENELREQIIHELLSENERISDNLRRRSSDSEKYLKTNSSDDFPMHHHRLYKKNSKYKSLKNDIFDSDYDSDNGFDEGNNIFIIPELPSGQTLIIDILSTWGDKYYVGLNGIEIFDKDGKIAKVKKVAAVPPDVNILPECKNDPRIVSNLLDGVNRTQDDMHIWLAPFDAGCSHIITIEFETVTTVAMIRIWNYNKSRIHSYRGVKDIVMLLDGFPIFKGDIAKASGGILGGIHTFGDTILFTTDDEILENISKNDTSFSSLTSDPETPVSVDRPLTSARHPEGRPVTGRNNSEVSITPDSMGEQILLAAKKIDMVLLSNWGHSHLIGLTGLEVIQGEDTLPLKRNTISCNVEKKSIFMNRLINEKNVTTDSKNMWSTIYRPGEEIIISVDLGDVKYISGLRIWNYNENLEKSYGGVRTVMLFLDGKPVVNPLTQDNIFLLRRAPGNEHYDFVQDIRLSDEVCEEYRKRSGPSRGDCSNLPEGFVFQFIIYSTWGDQYYCGLNGIELYNEYGRKIILEEQNICAYPESVNVLPDLQDDVRTPDKLIDGVNDDLTGVHSWLAPIIPKHLNRIYVVMDQPITISYIKMWNYSKAPSRGIKDFGILIDDLLVHNGTLNKYSDSNNTYQAVLFTENDQILGEHHHVLKRNSNVVHDILMSNEDIKSTTDGKHSEPDPALRPFTSVNLFGRGFLSHSN